MDRQNQELKACTRDELVLGAAEKHIGGCLVGVLMGLFWSLQTRRALKAVETEGE
jgi:membrane associated rhomboid family serine protease